LFAALPVQVDWVLLSEPRHLVYFASFYATPFMFRTQNASALLILGADGSSTLITDNMLAGYAQQAHADERISVNWYTGKGSAPERQGVLVAAGLAAMESRGGVRIGFDQMVPAELALALARDRGGLQPAFVNGVSATLMRRKDPDEIAVLRRGIGAMETGFVAARSGIRPGMTELQAYAFVTGVVLEALAEQALVYGDFASGVRAEKKGGPPTSRVIERGDLFLLDFSTVVYGYRGDFTNTWIVGGVPTSRQRELASFCIEAMHEGERLLKPGSRGHDIDAALRQVFDRHRVLDHFPHHSGHGIGLGHPDPPYLTPGSEDVLVEGDVVTLEPGLYVDGIGGMRFERNYLITASGFELLTHHHIGLE
jgi:Xaa-Pro aminopeptidase